MIISKKNFWPKKKEILVTQKNSIHNNSACKISETKNWELNLAGKYNENGGCLRTRTGENGGCLSQPTIWAHSLP